MRKVLRLFCFICCLMVLAMGHGQARSLTDDWIQGIVVDQNGEAIIGASVFEKGTQNGTVTDVDGKFKLNVQNYENILEVSYT